MPHKILFILHLPPPVHGAAVVGQYIKDSVLINTSFNCHYINLSTSENLDEIGTYSVRKIKQFIGLLYTIQKTIKRLRPDAVYVTANAAGGAFYKDFIVVEYLKKLGSSVIVHFHNKGVADRQNYYIDTVLYRSFFKNIKVILLAERLYGDIKKYADKKDVFICPNGIPDGVAGENIGERNNQIPHILFFSNLIISKGVLVLLDACLMLKKRNVRFQCDFAGGETNEIDKCGLDAEVKKRNLQREVTYHGSKQGIEKEKIFLNADIFVFPTFYQKECFPLVLLEAMKYQLPVITTNEGGIPEIVQDGETGTIVEKENADILARAIEILLVDTVERTRLGIAGRSRYERYFTLGIFEENFRNILGTILA